MIYNIFLDHINLLYKYKQIYEGLSTYLHIYVYLRDCIV